MTNEGRETFERSVFLVFTWIVVGMICFGAGRCSKIDNSSRPVEEIIKANSIIKVNDNIKIKVEQLDSIKNAKIIEVQALDNDSTVSLFYELISK